MSTYFLLCCQFGINHNNCRPIFNHILCQEGGLDRLTRGIDDSWLEEASYLKIPN